jgi:hypothetical protein
MQSSLFESWKFGQLYSHEHKHHQDLHGDGTHIYANNVDIVWQQVKINIKIMWNLGEGQLFTIMFINDNEFIESEIVILTKRINIKLV